MAIKQLTHWVREQNSYTYWYICPFCGFGAYDGYGGQNQEKTEYCPKCGKYMFHTEPLSCNECQYNHITMCLHEEMINCFEMVGQDGCREGCPLNVEKEQSMTTEEAIKWIDHYLMHGRWVNGRIPPKVDKKWQAGRIAIEAIRALDNNQGQWELDNDFPLYTQSFSYKCLKCGRHSDVDYPYCCWCGSKNISKDGK